MGQRKAWIATRPPAKTDVLVENDALSGMTTGKVDHDPADMQLAGVRYEAKVRASKCREASPST